MRKIFFTILSLMILSFTASSLSAKGMKRGMADGGCGGMGMGMHRPFQHLDMLQDELDLTNAQVDKLYKIDKDFMDRVHQNRTDDVKINDLREKHHAEIENILTPEQKVKFNKFKDRRPMKDKAKKDKRMKDKNCPAFGPMNGMQGYHHGMMQKDLGLSDEQFDKIYKIHRDYMDRFYENRHDADKVKELRAKQDAEIGSILTAEQKTKWDEFKNNPPKRPENKKRRK